MPDLTNYPSISVVIPSFNQGQYIEEAILSVIGQQYPKLQLIVIDGGSTDNTVEILERYSDHIFYWHSQKDAGQADAINQGMRLCTGDVVCWLNSDDMYMPGTLLDIGRRFCGRADDNYLIYGAAISVKQSDELSTGTQTSSPFDAAKLTHNDFIIQPSTFWTRTLWQRIGELDVDYRYVLDWEWFIRASKIAHFEYVPRFYSIYRLHPLHKTGNGGVERRKEIIEIVNTYSSNYWVKLYSRINNAFERIYSANKLLAQFKVFKRHLIIPILFPEVAFTIKNPRDFYTVLRMFQIQYR